MHPLSDFSINVSSIVSCTTHACPHHSEVTVPLSCHFSISSLLHIRPTHASTLSIMPIAVSVCCLITIWLSLKCGLFMVSQMWSCKHKSRLTEFILTCGRWWRDSGSLLDDMAWKQQIYEYVYFYITDFPSCFPKLFHCRYMLHCTCILCCA